MIVSAFEAWRQRQRGAVVRQTRHRSRARLAWAVAESMGLPALFIGVSALLHPVDPFWVLSRFPWAWLAPLIVALRYGFVLGTTSTVTLLLLWFAAPGWGLAPGPQPFPREYFLGGLIAVLIAGEFADVWNLRLRGTSGAARYLEERLTALTRNHFLLRLSHERIEHELLTRPSTLRETLLNLRTITQAAAATPDAPPLPGGKEFLQLLAQSCQIEVASLHAIERGVFKGQPVATLGQPRKLETRNAMLNEALSTGELVHLLSAEYEAAEQAASGQAVMSSGVTDQEPYLVCAPLTAANGERIGVLAVERMSFVALNQDVLRLLSVLVGYYADGVAAASAIAPVRAVVPDCPDDFALELTRLTNVRAEIGLDSALVALEFPHESRDDAVDHTAENLRAADLYERAQRLPRQIDIVWGVHSPERDVLLILLPLARRAGVEGFLARVESIFHVQFGIGLDSQYATTHTALLSEADPAWQLRDMLIRCRLTTFISHEPMTITTRDASPSSSSPSSKADVA
ncbi:MAG TPA: PelD GGDEF domain-containing protein [Burkholderiaceae bacterium]|nr:PelD GGDEF domain-containing protein [Burkholderiaceae bacterium]